MRKLRVFIVDDSVVYRSQIKEALAGLPWVEVVGVASSGKIAIQRLEQVGIDLAIIDLEMPEMDGIATLTRIRERNFAVQTIVFASASKRAAETTFEALRLGARDFVVKPGAGDAGGGTPADRVRGALESKLRAVYESVAPPESAPIAGSKPRAPEAFPSVLWERFRPEIVVVASSTGGPTVLERIFTGVAAPPHVPIVVVQHMPPIFTAGLAERIAKLSGIPAKEAEDGETVAGGRIYVAPGDFHIRLAREGARTVVRRDRSPPVNSVRPAADPLFESASRIYGARCLGFVLTGMGEDGKTGAIDIKRRGGAVVIQDRSSSVVYGMPGAVRDAGAYDRIATPEEIIEILKALAGESVASINPKGIRHA